MTRADYLDRGISHLYGATYARDEQGNELRRCPIDPSMKKVLDSMRERISMRAMIELTADRARE